MIKYISLCIFWLQSFYAIGAVSTNLAANSINQTGERYGHLKCLMDDLQTQEWYEDETLCAELLTKIMINVLNSTLWATWIWDSMQNPVGHLYGSKNNFGNYDECLEFPWEKVHPEMRTQYCLARVHLSEVNLQIDEVDLFGNVSNYIQAKTKHHLKFNTLNWGVCTPVACKPKSVAKFVGVLFRHSYLGLAVRDPNIIVDHCDIAGDEEVSNGIGFYLTLLFILSAVAFTLLATYILNSKGHEHRYTDFLKLFDIPSNINCLVKVTDNEISSLFGVRVISCGMVIGMHVFYFTKGGNVSNGLSLDKGYDIITTIIFTSEMAVDTFLFMSGLLLIRNLMRNDLQKMNPLKGIMKRYIRITWLPCVVFLIILNLSGNIPRGPATKAVLGPEFDSCHKNWWAIPLTIQNYYDTENMCHPVVWSLAVDFHLSVLAILMFWVYLKNRRHGLWLFLVGLIVSITTPAVLVYSDYRRYRPLAVDFRFTDDYRKSVFLNEPYIHTHFRGGSYLVGMAVGYIMTRYNPVIHRNIINKKLAVLGFCLFMVMFIGVFAIGDLILKRDYSPLEAASYLTFKRVVWAGLIGILVMICEYGPLPLVTNFLSWSAWAPISRLSFGMYLIHQVFLYYVLSANRHPNQYELLGFVSNFMYEYLLQILQVLNTLGMIVFSSIISLFLWIFFEAPMQNLISLLFRTRQKQRGGVITEDIGHGTPNVEEQKNKKEK